MSTVEEIVEAIKELPPEEWDEVKRRIVSLWLSSERPDLAREIEPKLYRNMLTAPRKRSQPRRPPIQIKGKPVSETLIEERR